MVNDPLRRMELSAAPAHDFRRSVQPLLADNHESLGTVTTWGWEFDVVLITIGVPPLYLSVLWMLASLSAEFVKRDE